MVAREAPAREISVIEGGVSRPGPMGVRRLLRAFRALQGGRALLWLLAGAVASLTMAGVELAIAAFLQLLLKTLGLLSKEVQMLPVLKGIELSSAGLAAMLVVIGLVRALSQFVGAASGNISQEAITARLRRVAVYEMLLHPDQRYVPAALVNARVGDIALKSSYFGSSLAMLITSAIQAAALVAIMLVAAPRESAIAILGLGVVGLMAFGINRRAQAIITRIPEELRVLTEGIERVARNSMLVRTLRTQAIEHRRLAGAVDAYQNHSIRAAILGSISFAITPFFGILLILVVLTMGQNVFSTPALVLVSFLYLFIRFVQALASTVAQLSACNLLSPQMRLSLAYVSGFTDAQIDDAISRREVGPSRATRKRSADRGSPPAIRVQGLTFRYPGAPEPVLRGVSAEIEPGSQFAIVGPSGRGKSTLLALLLGILEPEAGTVRLGERPPAEYFADPEIRVGYVGAEAFLVAGSVRDNMRYGVSFDATDEELWEALSWAKLHEVVKVLPGQLDYPIAEDGSGLSAGQKQRLCLARALLNDPHVLVLDEASANLDEGTEHEIAESIRDLRGKTTVVIVSHRKGILVFADRVVELGAPSSSLADQELSGV